MFQDIRLTLVNLSTIMRVQLAKECKGATVCEFRGELGEVPILGTVRKGGTIEVEEVVGGCKDSRDVFGEADDGCEERC